MLRVAETNQSLTDVLQQAGSFLLPVTLMPESNDNVHTKPRQTGLATFRRAFLYVVLALMICAIVYDYVIARPAVRLAYQRIETESRVVNAAGGAGFLSSTDVQELLDKQPTETFMDGSDYVEVFTWTGGLPGKPHKLWAVYKTNADEKLFYRHAMFVYEGSDDVSSINRMTVPELSDEEIARIYAEGEMSAGQAKREEIARQGEQARTQRAQMDAQCAAWKSEIDRLEPHRRQYFTNEEGETERMDDEKRVAQVASLKQKVAASCNS